MLAIDGAKANGVALGAQPKLVASEVTVVVLPDTGHWILEERSNETIAALTQFRRESARSNARALRVSSI